MSVGSIYGVWCYLSTFVEFITPFFQVLKFVNACVATMDADSDLEPDFDGFLSEPVRILVKMNMLRQLWAPAAIFHLINPLNPDKKPVVGSPTLGLQQKNPKNLFSNVLPW